MERTSGFFLVVAGNIGVGKTTFTQLIHDHLGWQPYFERVSENPYLHNFYQNMQLWGFHSQIYFLTQRFKAHLQINKIDIPVTQDRSIYEDAEVFAKNLYDQGVLSEQDYSTYRDLYESMRKALIPPDLTVYLRASPWTLLSRIRKRWRKAERDIDREYLFQLNLSYEKWIKEWQNENPVQIIETDGRDFLSEPDWTKKIITHIGECYQQTERK
jgi:deoxyadenosine/deoxycytidine kinase